MGRLEYLLILDLYNNIVIVYMGVVYYANESGKCPALQYLANLNDKTHVARIVRALDLLEQFGHNVLARSGDIKKISGWRNIWEIKVDCPGHVTYRVLFSSPGSNVLILSIFNKKEMKIRRKEIKKAVARLNRFYGSN